MTTLRPDEGETPRSVRSRLQRTCCNAACPVQESQHFKLNFRRNRRELGATMVATNAGIREAQAGKGSQALQFFELPQFHGERMRFYGDTMAEITRASS
jgi:hypothetical protein